LTTSASGFYSIKIHQKGCSGLGVKGPSTFIQVEEIKVSIACMNQSAVVLFEQCESSKRPI
jgi:hypothetical protein